MSQNHFLSWAAFPLLYRYGHLVAAFSLKLSRIKGHCLILHQHNSFFLNIILMKVVKYFNVQISLDQP